MDQNKKNKDGAQKGGYSGPRCIMITGAAGYVGAMLCDQFSHSPDLEEIIAIDKEPMPDLLKENKKIHWICADLSEDTWREEAGKVEPEVLIHSAWQIEEIYDDEENQRRLNIGGAEKVFDFAFGQSSINKIIYFSTVAAYGAFDTNKKDNFFLEGDILKEDEYLYGKEKKEAENILAGKYAESDRSKTVIVVRPTTIIGPRLRYMMTEKHGSYYALNKTPFIPVANNNWGMQYIHEDDLTDIIAILTFSPLPFKGYEVFNLSSKDTVFGSEIAKIFKKETIGIIPIAARMFFFLLWHITQGKYSIGAGAWKYLSYPIFVDGSKVEKKLGFRYTFSSHEALEKEEGRYDYAKTKIEEKKEEISELNPEAIVEDIKEFEKAEPQKAEVIEEKIEKPAKKRGRKKQNGGE